MNLQLILSLLFSLALPLPPPPGLIKQHAHKKELFKRVLGITNLIKPFLTIVPVLYPLKTPEAF